MSLAEVRAALKNVLATDASLLAWAARFNKNEFVQLDVQRKVELLDPSHCPLQMFELAGAEYEPPLVGGYQLQVERTIDVAFGYMEQDADKVAGHQDALIDLMPDVLMRNRTLTVAGAKNADSAWLVEEAHDQNLFHPKHFINFSIRVAYTITRTG